MTHPAVEISNVSKHYSNHKAVSDLTLTIEQGSIFGLLGPNGAGKTTTLRMILNILAPDEGDIFIFGYPASAEGISDFIGYLPEERGLYPKMRVGKVLKFLADLKGVAAKDSHDRINYWAERLSLKTDHTNWLDAQVQALSRGMQQKVQFIATMLHNPALVILDEPFSGLDAINAQTIFEIIQELRDSGKTIILSTHIINNAESICDEVCILSKGTKLLHGTVQEIKDDYGDPPVEKTIIEQSSLQDIFIRQVRQSYE